ncbi:MAG: ABC transporter ATP-binding protein [Acidimicrobiales bacterium]
MELTGLTLPDEALLDVRALQVRHGGQPALRGVSFAVSPGEVLAVLGANGSGRTTLLRALAGISPIAGGTVCWRGRDITTMPTARRVELGIMMVAGAQAVFPHLSVADNLLTGCHRFAWDRDRVAARIDAVTAVFAVLGERLEQLAGSLSGGEQQMLAIAKALVASPTLLLLDEPSLGLASGAVDQLASAVGHLVARGVTVIVVEQSPATAAAFANRTLLLERGEVRSDGPISDLRITPSSS